MEKSQKSKSKGNFDFYCFSVSAHTNKQKPPKKQLETRFFFLKLLLHFSFKYIQACKTIFINYEFNGLFITLIFFDTIIL